MLGFLLWFLHETEKENKEKRKRTYELSDKEIEIIKKHRRKKSKREMFLEHAQMRANVYAELKSLKKK